MNTTTKTTFEYAVKNGNSTENQNIKSQFVSRDVHANVNTMAEYILKQSYEDRDAPFSYDDIENFYSYPEWSETVVGEHLYFGGGTEDDKNTFLANFDRLIEESQDLLDAEGISEETHERNVAQIEDKKADFEAIESEPQEVFEWWLVSSWLCEKLAERGEPVIKEENIWGRTTTGQAILLDHVITEICAGMEILDGQANSWTTKKQ